MKFEYLRTLGSLDLKCSFGSMFMFGVALVVLALRFLLVKFMEAQFLVMFTSILVAHATFYLRFCYRRCIPDELPFVCFSFLAPLNKFLSILK